MIALETFRAGRDDRAWAVLEGFHALKHALRFGVDVRVVLATDPEALEELASELAPDLGGRFRELASEVTAEQLRGLVAHVPHTGVLALARRPAVDVARVLADPRPAPVVFLEDPRDLGNLGAVIRVAAAADAAAVLTSGSQDPWDPAALRGAAGLHYALPVAHVDALETAGRPLLAIDPGGEPLRPDRLPPRAVLAFGTERHGLSAELLSRADARLSIPMRAGVSSLNLATAVAAVLYSQRPAPL